MVTITFLILREAACFYNRVLVDLLKQFLWLEWEHREANLKGCEYFNKSVYKSA